MTSWDSERSSPPDQSISWVDSSDSASNWLDDPVGGAVPTAHPSPPQADPTPRLPAHSPGEPGKSGPASPTPRAQWPWVLVVLTLVTCVTAGVLTYRALETVDPISGDPFGDFFEWSVLFAVSGVILLVLCVVSAALTLRRSTRRLGAVSLLVAMSFGPAAVFIGGQQGADAIQTKVRASVAGRSGRAIVELADLARAEGVSLGPLGSIIDAITK